MSKKIILMLLFFVFTAKVQANDNNLVNKEYTYLKLLEKFDCNLGSNINNPTWSCNQFAPKGWAEFYGEKLKNEKQKRKRFANK